MDGRASRRAVLAGLGGTLAGCVGGDPDGDEAPGTPTGTPTRTPTRTPTGTPTAGAPAVSLDVEVRAPFTGSGPARLRFALSNDTADGLVVRTNASAGQGGPFTAVWGDHRSGDARLGLFRRDGWAAKCVGETGSSTVPDSPVDGCWRPPCRAVDLPSLHGQFEVPPGGERAGVYVLLDGFNDECLPGGTYAFDGERGNVSARVARGEIRDGDPELTAEPVALVRTATVTVGGDRTVSATAEATVGD